MTSPPQAVGEETPNTDVYRVEEVGERRRGGQHAGVQILPIRVTHLPTGLSAVAHARSQYLSRKIATEMIEFGLTYARDLVMK